MLIPLLVVIMLVSTASASCACDRVEVFATNLNYRIEPWGTILGQVNTGDCLQYLGTCASGWYNVSVSGQQACVSTSYTIYTGPCTCGCDHVEVTANVLNYRSGPYPATVLGQVYSGYCLPFLGTCASGWSKLSISEKEGCVSSSYVNYKGPCFSSTCMSGVCAGRGNVQRGCDPSGCGHYGASRGTGTHKGSDVVCSAGDTVTAPFDGRVVRTAQPYGSGSCIDDGFVFESTDSNFQGLSIKVFYANGYTVGAQVPRGGVIATHIGLHCEYSSSMTDHIHVEVSLNGIRVDPTIHLYCS